MHVVERGTGSPLVLFHGFGVDHRLLLPLDPAINTTGGWRRLYFDLPGHGKSPVGAVTSSEELVAAVESELRFRVGTEPFALIGTSFGGMIARRIAHDFRDQVLGLAVIAPVIIASHEHRVVPERVVLSSDPSLMEELGDAGTEYAEMAVVQSAGHAKAFFTHVQPGLAMADEAALERIAKSYAFDEDPELASPAPFVQPSLFLTGRQDQVVGYKDAWHKIDHYPRATFAVLDAAGHNLHLEQPALTDAHITEWLARVTTDRLLD